MTRGDESLRQRLLAIGLLGSFACCASPAPPSESTGEDVATGTLAGVVRLAEGVPVPEPRVIENTTDPAVCGESHELADVTVSPDNRGISEVIVAFTDLAAAPTPPTTLTLDNRDCEFSPRVAVATLGSLLEATNSDPVLHTTHLYGPREMNVSLPMMGAKQTRVLAASGLFVIKCDIHGWMEAYVRVDEHPHHAVTDRSGAFRIAGVPVGRHRIELWHPRLGSLEREVEIADDDTTSIEVDFQIEEDGR